MHFTQYDTRLAGYAWIVEDGRALLTWYNGEGRGEPCWSLPGGGIEFDETIVEGVVREAHEETGLLVEVGRPLTTSSFVIEREGGRPYKSCRVIFEAVVLGGTLGTLEVGGSTDFAAWVPLDRLAEEPSVADIVRQAWEAWKAAIDG